MRRAASLAQDAAEHLRELLRDAELLVLAEQLLHVAAHDVVPLAGSDGFFDAEGCGSVELELTEVLVVEQRLAPALTGAAGGFGELVEPFAAARQEHQVVNRRT